MTRRSGKSDRETRTFAPTKQGLRTARTGNFPLLMKLDQKTNCKNALRAPRKLESRRPCRPRMGSKTPGCSLPSYPAAGGPSPAPISERIRRVPPRFEPLRRITSHSPYTLPCEPMSWENEHQDQPKTCFSPFVTNFERFTPPVGAGSTFRARLWAEAQF